MKFDYDSFSDGYTTDNIRNDSNSSISAKQILEAIEELKKNIPEKPLLILKEDDYPKVQNYFKDIIPLKFWSPFLKYGSYFDLKDFFEIRFSEVAFKPFIIYDRNLTKRVEHNRFDELLNIKPTKIIMLDW